MKAWVIFERHLCDGALLVFADTANKARTIAVNNGTWEWEYMDTRAHREKEYDQYYQGRSVIESNDELPQEAPDFYNEECYF